MTMDKHKDYEDGGYCMICDSDSGTLECYDVDCDSDYYKDARF